MESDAEWIDVEREFGGNIPTLRPPPSLPPREPPFTRPPPPRRPTGPREAPEKAPSSPSTPTSSTAGLVAGCVGGILGVVLVLLLVYMVVLRRRLSKAKSNGRESGYHLRVEDVAHISNLDETTNTYVNTTDLQKLVASVRAKGKSQSRLPTPPRFQHQTPAAYRPDSWTSNDGFQDDKVVLRAPMPPPHTATITDFMQPLPQPDSQPQAVQEVMYSNLEECAAPPRPTPRLQPPKTSPPPPPTKEMQPSNTQPARPAPAPPSSPPPTTPQPTKPAPPCPTLKPSKGSPTAQARVGAKPTPPTLPKPKAKAAALPPLKMVLRGTVERAGSAECETPDTALTHLSPDSTPTGEGSPGVTSSITAKIALLEGHMKQVGGGGMSRPRGVRP